ncbi:protein of unknown function [Candidatus Nitrosocosmicus franklandus]|uniref:Uncharacterized protein n=1 Tax=Candidatus Nitrosocosmicus franklandianus TaxID=1798806 RepID=A0A484IAB4_9ARCH|nr:protein of unknown function [Candidatus Nitrosocosmicus franklandus]
MEDNNGKLDNIIKFCQLKFDTWFKGDDNDVKEIIGFFEHIIKS